jgi:hypothetical protein
VGLAVGTVVGASVFSGACEENESAGCAFIVGAAYVGAPAFVIGAGIGLALGEDEWEQVALDRIRLTITPQGDGVLTLSVLVTFWSRCVGLAESLPEPSEELFGIVLRRLANMLPDGRDCLLERSGTSSAKQLLSLGCVSATHYQWLFQSAYIDEVAVVGPWLGSIDEIQVDNRSAMNPQEMAVR